jgi:hypothetical protein
MPAHDAAMAIENAWTLLDEAARLIGVALPREAVMAQAVSSAESSSWNALEFLLAWADSIGETGQLPAALARLLATSEGGS